MPQSMLSQIRETLASFGLKTTAFNAGQQPAPVKPRDSAAAPEPPAVLLDQETVVPMHTALRRPGEHRPSLRQRRTGPNPAASADAQASAAALTAATAEKNTSAFARLQATSRFPDEPEEWQVLHDWCTAEGVDFADLVGDHCINGITALEKLLIGHHWTTVWKLHTLLPTRVYADGRVSLGENFVCINDANGRPQGPTCVHKQKGYIFEGEYTDQGSQGIISFKDNAGYEFQGNCLNGKPHGFGRVRFPDGMQYIGHLDQRRILGLGTLTLPDGKIITKEWQPGESQIIFGVG
jgi:hypothetical protein